MPSENESPDTNTPKYITAEEVAAMVTGAITAHSKKLQKELTASIEGLKLDEKIANALKAAVPAEAPDGEHKPRTVDPRLVALEDKAKQLEASLAKSEQARSEAVQRSRDESARSALKAALSAGVAPGATDMAAKLLFDAEKRIGFDEDGTPFFRTRRSPGHGMPEEDMQMPLADGVKHWLQSDDAKIFVPAPAPAPGANRGQAPRQLTRGSDGMPRYEQPATTDNEKAHRAIERESALKARFNL